MVWIKAALLQQLYGIENDARWIEELQFNVLYRWFVGLDGRLAHCWTPSEHARAWLKMHGSPELLAAFCDLVGVARAVIPCAPSLLNRDLAALERKGVSAGAKVSGTARPAKHQTAAGLVRGDAVFKHAISLIRERISDVSLSPDEIAAALNVSRRTLYYVFRERGSSPAAAIRDERLEYCKRLLNDPAQRHRKIISLALDSGFNDIATFCRQFKCRYGISPSSVRANGDGAVLPSRSAASYPRASQQVSAM